jgi:hypothetical protein
MLPEPVLGLEQKLRFCAVDWDGSPGVTAVMARGAVLLDGQFTCDTLRQRRESFPKVVNGGYHFSWFGGPERFRDKAVCSPHQETLETNLRLAAEGFAWQRGLGGIPDNDTVTGDVAEITDDYPVWVRDRKCPWYWWRPGSDMLPADFMARADEMERRRVAFTSDDICADHRSVQQSLGLPASVWHADDGTPCPSAALEIFR